MSECRSDIIQPVKPCDLISAAYDPCTHALKAFIRQNVLYMNMYSRYMFSSDVGIRTEWKFNILKRCVFRQRLNEVIGEPFPADAGALQNARLQSFVYPVMLSAKMQCCGH